jgi:hypothetical protein
VKHFHEHLQRRHGFGWGYTWTKTRLHAAGLIERAARRGAHRRKPRKPCIGMMLHQDASRYAWLEGEPDLDLVVTMDDASSEVYSAFLVDEEGTASSFRGLLEVLAAEGLPSSLYTIEHIPAYSPEARGRSERMFGTLQGPAAQESGRKRGE